MSGFGGWMKAIVLIGAGLSVTACVSYPSEPRYSTRAGPAPQPGYAQPGAYPAPTVAPNEAPLPSTAPVESIEGGALETPAPSYNTGPIYVAPPAVAPYSPPVPTTSVTAGAAYVIQPGDTISGVGRRFQTPVQNLIDLNGLGPRGAITVGQSIVLPDTAIDTGGDPYATGQAPIGVGVPRNGVIPPPPPPPSGNAALPPPPRQPLTTSTPSRAPVTAGNIALQWPVRGEIVRRFGPVGLGERNNGINIGASAGTQVNASAAGRVAYVGDDLVGQGLTVLIVHPNGWRTVYGHLGSSTVDDGDDVRAGQQIGTVGLTAGDGRPSIHFETRRMQGDDPVAIDPVTVLPR